MAYTQGAPFSMANRLILPYIAGGTIIPFTFVKLDTDDDKVVQCTAAGTDCIGVVVGYGENDSITVGMPVDVLVFGFAKVKSVGSVTKGARITTSDAGYLQAATSGHRCMGNAFEASASGDYTTCFINHTGYVLA